MSNARYLLRFDDICPTMNWTIWEAIEEQLVRYNTRPILAVVPDNRDPKLMVDNPRADFWDRVRKWQSMGYTIALHGYQHVYVNQKPGLMGLTNQSEFAGLPRAEQEAKLKKGLEIFAQQGVRVDAWVAPSHSFDRTTVSVLSELGVKVISDGLWPWPFTERSGVTWIPQQLWTFRRRPAGVWTVCNHHNSWTQRDVEKLGEKLATFEAEMTDLATMAREYATRRITLLDRLKAFHRLMWNHRLRPALYEVYSFLRRLTGSRTNYSR